MKPGVQSPALLAVLVDEGLLDRMQRPCFPVAQALDGRDLGAVEACRQRQAGARRAIADEHGAHTADAVLTAHVRAAQVQLVPQEISKRRAVARLPCGRRGR